MSHKMKSRFELKLAVIMATWLLVACAKDAAPADGEVKVVPFDLGDATLVQTGEMDDRYREMPVRLNGMIAAPAVGDALPLAIIIHGSHGTGCPSPDGMADEWPCQDVEKAHYEGFAYLIEALAKQGYVAVSINANPAFAAAYGDAKYTMRLPLLVDLYLSRIAAAVSGEDVAFGVELANRVDLSKLAVLGHSASGEGVTWLVDSRAGHDAPEQIRSGQGPVAAAILLAPASLATQEATMAVPFAVILPSCDRDVVGLDGQNYYESARRQPHRDEVAVSLLMRGANHNRFNTTLEDETLGRASSDCENRLMPAEDQRAFLADYVPRFFNAALSEAGDADLQAIGLDAYAPAPAEILGQRVLTSLALQSSRRLIVPLDAPDLSGEATAVFCQAGYALPEKAQPACKQDVLTQPGHPERVAVAWKKLGAVYEVGMPGGVADVSDFAVLHLRVAVDPLNGLNPAGEAQALSLRLTDAAGESAAIKLVGEPALAYPPGKTWSDGQNTFWDSPVVLSSIRVPLTAFEGVNLSALRSVALVFDAAPSGAIFLTDLELVTKDGDDMTQSSTANSGNHKPAYVNDLEGIYGPPSAAGFGSAIFHEQLADGADVEAMAKQVYRSFVGDLWEKWGEAKWMGPWKEVYARPAGGARDVVAELRAIGDRQVHVSVPMLLDEVEDASKARQALEVAYDAPEVSDFRVYAIGDGEQMSGMILAGRRESGEATFLVFLMD